MVRVCRWEPGAFASSVSFVISVVTGNVINNAVNTSCVPRCATLC